MADGDIDVINVLLPHSAQDAAPGEIAAPQYTQYFCSSAPQYAQYFCLSICDPPLDEKINQKRKRGLIKLKDCYLCRGAWLSPERFYHPIKTMNE
ncbi:MAG TPA: hypothetical protein VEF35_01740 [Candidatus Bathyarchaeia archaeon]|nr:hypothetical protein [Candidatus Bathyarchaeia archaeon]